VQEKIKNTGKKQKNINYKAQSKFRINFFEQLNEFYKIVFTGTIRLTSQHISIYMFLLNQNNRLNWCEWFRVSIDLMIQGTSITRVKTIYKLTEELRQYGLIDYIKGINIYSARKFKINKLDKNATLTAPLSTKVNDNLTGPLLVLLSDTLPDYLELIKYNEFKIKLHKAIIDNMKKLKESEYLIQIRKK
jgi:hypothetical protein